MIRSSLASLLCCAALLTAACESSEERAEEHFQEGVALLEAGDVDRALVEFRNVFRLDGMHKEARRLYAQAEAERGNIRSSYSQYLRLVEQYPDDVDARRELTRLALSRGQWDEVEKHSPHVIEADANDELGRLADISLRYHKALEEEDNSALGQIAQEAQELRETIPDHPILAELLADYYVREGRREDALDEIEIAIENSENPRNLYAMKLGLLQEMGDFDAVETTLLDMVELFPDDPAIPATMVRWYLSQDRVDQAESFLRTRAEEGSSGHKIDLVRFLVEYRDRPTAIAELDRLREEDPENASLYRSVRAGLKFESGEQEEAISELQSLIDEAPEDDDHLRSVKIALAQMLNQTGNSVGARALVEEVLASDPNHVAALKMRAGWLIEADETDEAILTLRTALEQSPRDPSLMTLMAQAYERAGNRSLMAEMLSLAVEVSNKAPEESLRYARYLLSDDKPNVAESTLVDSLRLNPDHPDLLALLGSLHVNRGAWGPAEQVANTLASLEDPSAEAAANELRARILSGQGRNEEVVDFLEQLIDSGEGGFGAQVGIVRTHIQSGNLDTAMDYVNERLASNPEEPTLKFLKGAVFEAMGRNDEAEALFSELTEENPEAVLVWRALYLLQQRQGETEAATETLDAALEANPDSADLLWIKASELQRAGDLEAALDVYARMYELNSSAQIIANNYASLLTTLRTDDESVERAYNVARRLQGAEVPAFQDTFGWIAYLRGDHETAVEYLEPAAEALSDDPTVQYHAALAFEAAGRVEDAKAALEKAIELTGDGAALPQLEEARQKLAELQATDE